MIGGGEDMDKLKSEPVEQLEREEFREKFSRAWEQATPEVRSKVIEIL